MKQRICSTLLALSLACSAADGPETVRHVTAGPEDIIQLGTATFEYSSIVLPEPEKAVTYLCGDPKHWDVQIIEGAERFVNVKPSPGAHATDIQILTDHNHNYTVKAEIRTPVDIKLFLESTDLESLRKPPSFVPVTEVERLRSAEKDAEQRAAELQKQMLNHDDSLRTNFPKKLNFVYRFKQDEAPFFVDSVWDDGQFTYIKAHPSEVASFYDYRDGKPNLTQMDYADSVYTIRHVIDGGFLQVGKKRMEIFRKPGM